MKKDYYEILGVSKTASQDEIKSAFRKLAKKYPMKQKENNMINLVMLHLKIMELVDMISLDLIFRIYLEIYLVQALVLTLAVVLEVDPKVEIKSCVLI